MAKWRFLQRGHYGRLVIRHAPYEVVKLVRGKRVELSSGKKAFCKLA